MIKGPYPSGQCGRVRICGQYPRSDNRLCAMVNRVTRDMHARVLTLRQSIIVQGGLITSTGVVLVVLVLVFVVPGVVYLVLVAVVACHYFYDR